jgi:hypothetical protein
MMLWNKRKRTKMYEQLEFDFQYAEVQYRASQD